MAKCHVVMNVRDGGLAGTSTAITYCLRHELHDFISWTPGDGSGELFCPLGRIEQAVDDGLEKIAAAVKQATCPSTTT